MRLLAAISHHGLGHLAQAGPVLVAMKAIRQDLELTIWSGLADAALRSRIPFPFHHRAEAADVGLPMLDAVTVDIPAAEAAYRDFHTDWEQRVQREAAWLKAQRFHGVFSDVAYLPLAAARRADIPALALCSLNWRDIAGAYLAARPGMAHFLEEMDAAYRGADAFLRPAPAMPMPDLPNTLPISSIATRGQQRRAVLDRALGARSSTRRVLVGFGGIGYQGDLPQIEGVTWLVPDDWATCRSDVVAFCTLGLPFIDLMASSDALLTKVGYGSFVEAVAHGLPVLYIDRPDWPETPHLTAWLEQHGVAVGMSGEEIFSPKVSVWLDRLWARPAKPASETNGAAEAAHHILGLLTTGS